MKKNHYSWISTAKLLWRSKLLRTMRLTLFAILVSVVQIFATNADAQQTRLSLNLKNTSIRSVLGQIENQTDFYFIYNAKAVDVEKKMSIEVENESISEILDKIFEGTNVTYKIDKRQIAISTNLAENAVQQEITVSGRVTDSSGSPLPGATVIMKGTTKGTITNPDGIYSLSNVPSNATLVFSFIGMRTQEISIAGKTSVDVVMAEDAIGLEEVVAVGYGTMRKADITGAVSSVKGEELIKTKTYSVAQALQGKVSGVQITKNGDAGSSSKIRVRGLNTIGSNGPKVIVDGMTVGMSLEDLNPADIESIDVLKDASALAIFGISASGGVILVTTKRGSYGKKGLTVRADASFGVQFVSKKLDLTTPSQLVDLIDEARTNENNQLGGNYKLYDEIWPNDNWGRQQLTDWQDKLFNTGYVQDYSFSATGGADKSIYGFGISYRDQEGMMPQNFARRFTLRGSYETKLLNDKLKVGATFNYKISESFGSDQGNIWFADVYSAALMPGNIPAYFENGAPYQETDQDKNAYFMFGGTPMGNSIIDFYDRSNPSHGVVNSFYAELEIIKGLAFKSLLSQNYSQTTSLSYSLKSLNPAGNDASRGVGSSRWMGYSWDNTLTYNNKFGDLSVNALVGGNLGDGQWNSFSTSRQGFPEGDPVALRYLNFGDPESQTNSENAYNTRGASYFGRLNLNYDDKYLLTATARRDGSSVFYEDVRWGTFPSFSLGWRLSEEAFMSSLTWLDNLKIRAGWGQVGNSSVGSNYAYVSSVRSGYADPWGDGGTDAIFGESGTRHIGRAIYERGNQNVSWETTTMTNVGVDFSVKGFNGTIELYKNNTTDILVDAQFPEFVGYYPGTNMKINGGEVETKGFDFNLNYSKKLGDFSYNIGVNCAYSVNEIVELNDQEFVLGAGDSWKGLAYSMSRSYVGDPIGAFYGWETDGIFNMQAEVDAANQKARDFAAQQNPALTSSDLEGIYYISANTAPGDYKFNDLNGDGIITDEDKTYLGSGNPKFQFGINSDFSYKNFDMALNITGVTGVTIYAMLEPGLTYPGSLNTLTAVVDDHWTSENHSAKYPRAIISDPNNNFRSSDRWLYDGSYLRLQNIVLGYTLPTNLSEKIGLQKLRLYGNVQNLFTLTEYRFLDPEVQGTTQMGGNGSIDTGAGIDMGNAPTPTTFIFGININF